MKIKRFNEELDPIKMDNDRVDDIIKDLGEFKAIIDSKKDVITGLLEELEGKSKDSISSLQKIQESLFTTSEEIDTIIIDLENYKNDYTLPENN